MKGYYRGLIFGLSVLLLAAAGCGKPSLPGRQFTGETPETGTSPVAESPVPEQGVLEWGDPEAKVRVVAFFSIDEAHAELMEMMEGFTEEYPGKVYAKYVDRRTREGMGAFQRAGVAGSCVMINAKNEATIEAEPHPYTVDFVQEMGRHWTADQLRKAVAQEVARQY